MAPSSSGPGHLVLIQKIAGSNPAGVTTKKAQSFGWAFFVVKLKWVRTGLPVANPGPVADRPWEIG